MNANQNQIRVIRVNAAGCQFILDTMNQCMQPNRINPDAEAAVLFFAGQAEDHYAEGSDPIFEISGRNTISGNPETFELGYDHYDAGFIDEDGEYHFE